MATASHPRLRNTDDGSETFVTGRIFTFGSSLECGLRLTGKGIPDLVGHLLYRDGRYQIQVLDGNYPMGIASKWERLPICTYCGRIA